MKPILKILSTLTLLMGISGTAQATVIALTGFGDFGPGATQLTFAGVANGALSNHGGVTFSVGASTGNVGTDGTPGRTGPSDAQYVDNVFSQTGYYYSPLALSFSGPIGMVGFEARTNSPDALTLTAQLISNNNLVGTISYAAPGNSNWSFYGFSSTVAFDRLVIDPANNANGYIRIDNLTFQSTSVPEPAALGILGLGLALLGLSRRRKQKAA